MQVESAAETCLDRRLNGVATEGSEAVLPARFRDDAAQPSSRPPYESCPFTNFAAEV